jgi:LysR family transcriptional regulator, nitrogen assimilation regulatory protein
VELHIAQSALSQHVATLEAETRAMLLVRTSRGVQAIDAGRTLYQHARIILQQEAEAKAAVEVAAGVPTGQLAFGLPLSLVRVLGMPIFGAVRESWPGIELQVQEELSGTILEWLKSARLALGIAFDDHNLPGLHTVPLFEERLFLIVSPQSALARQKTIPLMEVAALTLVLPSYGQGVRACVDKAFTDAGLGEAQVSMEIDSHVMLKQYANLGTGPTILS